MEMARSSAFAPPAASVYSIRQAFEAYRFPAAADDRQFATHEPAVSGFSRLYDDPRFYGLSP